VPEDPSVVRGVSGYGPNRITAAVARDNVLATQFHPEKSPAAGLALLGRFLQGSTS
jgi:imidazoleglycerol phosphate synthase glutamine amidotransferase subunit HisH